MDWFAMTGAVLMATLWSYLISYVTDLRDFQRQGISIAKAIRRCRSPLVVSVVLRLVATGIGLHTFSILLHRWHPQQNPNMLMAGTLLVGAILVGTCMHVPHLILPRIHSSIAERRQINGMARSVLRMEKYTWRAILHELEFLQSEAFDLLWNGHQDRGPILTLFEEKKIIIIRYFYRKKESFGENLWLHYGLIAGDRDSRRIEALVHVFGVHHVGDEILALRNGRVSMHRIATDRRTYPREVWSNAAFLEKLETSLRPAERVLAEYIRFELKQPRRTPTKHKKQRPLPTQEHDPAGTNRRG